MSVGGDNVRSGAHTGGDLLGMQARDISIMAILEDCLVPCRSRFILSVFMLQVCLPRSRSKNCPFPGFFENSKKKSKGGADQEEFSKMAGVAEKKSGIFVIWGDFW